MYHSNTKRFKVQQQQQQHRKQISLTKVTTAVTQQPPWTLTTFRSGMRDLKLTSKKYRSSHYDGFLTQFHFLLKLLQINLNKTNFHSRTTNDLEYLKLKFCSSLYFMKLFDPFHTCQYINITSLLKITKSLLSNKVCQGLNSLGTSLFRIVPVSNLFVPTFHLVWEGSLKIVVMAELIFVQTKMLIF